MPLRPTRFSARYSSLDINGQSARDMSICDDPLSDAHLEFFADVSIEELAIVPSSGVPQLRGSVDLHARGHSAFEIRTHMIAGLRQILDDLETSRDLFDDTK